MKNSKLGLINKLQQFLTIIVITFLLINTSIFTKNTYFQLLSSKEQFSQVSFQTDTDGYILRNFNNGTTSIFEFQSTDILLEFNNFRDFSDISFKTPLELNTESLEIMMNYDNSKLTFDEVNQFYLYIFDDFQSQIKGWSVDATNVCGKNDNLFLGGPCKFGNMTVFKNFNDLPPHSEVRITANFHFFDGWEGEEAYMLVNDDAVWSDTYNWCPSAMIWMCSTKSISACGNEKADRLSVPIDFTFSHKDASFKLSFSAFLGEKQPCEASWGIDDVSIYLR